MSKKELYKYILLLTTIVFTGTLLFISNDSQIFIHIVSILLLCIISVYLSGYDLLHPYFWFSSIFTLYSISYPVLYAFDYITSYGYSKELIILQWFSLVIFLLIVSPKKVSQQKPIKFNQLSFLNNQFINILVVVLLISAFAINQLGFANKTEIYESGNIFLICTIRIAIILTIIYMYQLIYKILTSKKIDKLLILKVSAAILTLVLFSGERDLLFRFVAITLLILYAFSIVRNKHLLFLAPMFILMLPLSHIYKYFFLTGSMSGSNQISLNNLLFEFLNGEFVSASRNLQILLNNKDMTNGMFSGTTIINDFQRVIYNTGFSHGNWFNDLFFPNVSTTGYGFTLVGQGYVNFGYIGVLLLFTFIGLMVRTLYLKSNNNIYFFVIYIYSATIFMYSIRADLSNILVPFFRHLLLSMLIIKLIEILLSRKTVKNVEKQGIYLESIRE